MNRAFFCDKLSIKITKPPFQMALFYDFVFHSLDFNVAQFHAYALSLPESCYIQADHFATYDHDLSL